MLRLVTVTIALASSEREDIADPWSRSCWRNGSWFDCCAQSKPCWGSVRRQRTCCSSSPEVEPMLTDLHTCSNDVALRRAFRLVSHQQIGFEEDCVSLLVCKPTEGGWRAVRSGLAASCSIGSSAARLVPPLTDHLCSMLDPLPAEMWYDADGFERIRRRYRFGTANRHHCAVPAWLLVKEETLRLYTLIQAKSQVTRVLINIGAADAVMSDPLAGTLRTFQGGSSGRPPWRGIYFEAAQENCRAIRKELKKNRARIHVECGYTTPISVVPTICQQLRRQEIPGIGQVCHAAGVPGMSPVTSGTLPDSSVRVEVDAMNVDIDSYDCAVLREALRILSPKMISVEIFPYPPPTVVSSDYHPQHQESANRNISGKRAKLGGTGREGAFVMGCSLSAVVALLWPHGLGLYRLSARDALFVRGDVAREIELDPGGGPWIPADEFQCWRTLCADLGETENLMKLTSLGVHDHLMPWVHRRVRDKLLHGSFPAHPLTVTLAMPPPVHRLPDVKLFGVEKHVASSRDASMWKCSVAWLLR
ncbi:unnamed protein product [Symbiodinium sp. CCMP2592]|nr:unnamed protein product [Symbiodinium sp. CCMP2592]